jgi:predicted transcriptional regulator
MRVTSDVDDRTLDRLDEVASAQRRSRSSLIALILEKWALEQED